MTEEMQHQRAEPPPETLFYGWLERDHLKRVYITASQKGVVAIHLCLKDDEDYLAKVSTKFKTPPIYNPGHIPHTLKQLNEYFARERKVFDIKLDLRGLTDFQQRVLKFVQDIPYGTTRTYKEIARLMGKPRAVRAIGAANAANPIPILIPCHRVIGSDGKLTGYGAGNGVETKAYLLTMEGYLQTHRLPGM